LNPAVALAWFTLAAVLEIAGCFAFWGWLRQGGKPWLAAVGVVLLMLFAIVLTRIDSGYAGRTFAAYGGVYIAASLVWMWVVEGARPDRWDTLGAMICLSGAALVLFGPRG
jgi:small multidrug resistance family-3 protein